MFKKPKRSATASRKRDVADSDDESTGTAVITKKSKGKQETSEQQKTETFTSERAFSASGTASSLLKDTATRTIDIDGGDSIKPPTTVGSVVAEEGIYKGQASYTQYVNKQEEKVTQSNAGSKLLAGPLYAPTNVRLTTRFDYAIDVCKDYKETGHCGFGDNCVFLHDRGDYKTGWQIDLDWEKQERERKKQIEIDAFVLANRGDEVVEEDEEESLDCPVCGCEYKDPVQPACGHIVCEHCALKKPGVCRVCGEKTDGVFTASRDIRKLLKEKRVGEKARQEEIKARIGNPLEEEEQE